MRSVMWRSVQGCCRQTRRKTRSSSSPSEGIGLAIRQSPYGSRRNSEYTTAVVVTCQASVRAAGSISHEAAAYGEIAFADGAGTAPHPPIASRPVDLRSRPSEHTVVVLKRE